MKLTSLERVKGIRDLKVALKRPASEIKRTMAGAVGEISFNKSVYQPIVDFLSDHQIRALG